jgi:hypothetical protein
MEGRKTKKGQKKINTEEEVKKKNTDWQAKSDRHEVPLKRL